MSHRPCGCATKHPKELESKILLKKAPPYKNAMEAMRDGWQVIQMSEYKHRSEVDGYELGPLPYQTVLSRFSEMQEEEG